MLAILILKKEEPQITPSKTNKNISKDFASLISSLDCIYELSAYQPLLNVNT